MLSAIINLVGKRLKVGEEEWKGKQFDQSIFNISCTEQCIGPDTGILTRAKQMLGCRSGSP